MRFLFIALVLAVALAQIESAQNAGDIGVPDFKLFVDVELVVFNVTVHDANGHFVTGLTRDNFRVIEGGQEQTLQFVRPENIPATVGLVIDNSGSMRHKQSDVTNAALAFAQASNTEDELFIVNFNERVFMGLPKGVPFSSDINQLRAALSNTRAEGKTALYDAVTAGLKHLELGTHQRKALVIISDGGDNASGATESSVRTLAEQSSATIYAIQIEDPDDKDQNPKALQELAKITAGEAYRAKTVEELPNIWRKIAGGIRSQYTIGYVSTNRSHDETFRNVKVIATDKDGKPLHVRARKGYIAPRPHSQNG